MAAVVSVTVRILMKACSKHGCGFFGSGGFIIFEIEEGQENYEIYELVRSDTDAASCCGLACICNDVLGPFGSFCMAGQDGGAPPAGHHLKTKL